jgi:methylated-DNA-[protein]-cysteine S-methyltransferase
MNTLIAQARIDSPLGPMLLAATARGLAGLWFDGQMHHPGLLAAPHDAEQRFIAQARDELASYWRLGPRHPFAVPLDAAGTAFQQAVWQALRHIPAGRTSTYAQVAQQAGSPTAPRAAGAAIGRNPLSVIVPCHRVIGSSGALTGYAGGLARKQALLELEGALPAARRRA